MAKPACDLLKVFKRKVITLEKIRNKQEELFFNRALIQRDIEEVYAGIYLDIVATFEALIEDLFIGLLTRNVTIAKSSVTVKITTRYASVAREMIQHRRAYYPWFPYENTEQISRIFFTEGRPFVLEEEDKNHLNKCSYVRNAIAHHSYFSKNQFKKKVLLNLHLLAKEKNPKSFLRAQFSLSPSTNYYQQYITKIVSIAQKICG